MLLYCARHQFKSYIYSPQLTFLTSPALRRAFASKMSNPLYINDTPAEVKNAKVLAPSGFPGEGEAYELISRAFT